MTDLLNQKTVSRLCQDVTLSEKQNDSARQWLDLLNRGNLEKETENYRVFGDLILRDILNYSEEEIRGGTNKNKMEFHFSDSEGKKTLCFEAKGTKTENLFAMQNRNKGEHSTPIHQTWDYMGEFGMEYGVCTNYRHFVLITKQFGYSKYYLFDFKTISADPDKLREFVGIFSRNRMIEDGFVEKIQKESAVEEREFTKEFYKLFHETRLMMIKAFEEKENVTKSEAIYFTQLFLNRIIFIFFVEDRGFIPDKNLFTSRILSILDSDQCTEHSKKIHDDIRELFVIFDKGSKMLDITGFNGGLFNGMMPEKIYFSDIRDDKFFDDVKQYSMLSEDTKLNEKASRIIAKIPGINPIITNLLIMDSFDFNSEVNVNILGHIFEQSISDLEELKKEGRISKRKKDGVYYTSEHITDYICKNTIIPYLSKSKTANTPQDLVSEYTADDTLDELEEKFRNIKILDPACGSGAFLVKAVDILLEIHKIISDYKSSSGKYSTGDQTHITKWSEESNMRMIIEDNIYGVDINSQSVEIARLSMFFKTASYHRKLPDLSKNIVIGNSLISDRAVDTSGFLWEEKFPDIFIHPSLKKHIEQGHIDGFDVIIGNPPWQILKPDVDEFFSPLYENNTEDNAGGQKKFSMLAKNHKNNFMKKSLVSAQTLKDWNEYQDNYKRQMAFFKESDDYPHQVSRVSGKIASSDANLYKLFIEKSHALLKPDGYCGLVVPSGFYSDLGSKGLREFLLTKNKLIHLFSFINKKAIFQDVHRQFKFCTMIFSKGGKTNRFLASFYLNDDTNLDDYKKIAYDYDINLIKTSSPDSLSFVECKNKTEFEILEKLYQYPLLSSDEWTVFRPAREFDMTNDAKLFHTANIGNLLYEGKMMHMFTDKFSKPRYWIDEKEGGDVLRSKEINRMKKISKDHNISPRIDSEEYRLVWRGIASSTNERTLISTVLPPKRFLGNSLNYLKPLKFDGEKYVQPISNKEMFFICGMFNSFPVDFILRHKVSSNINNFYIMELPIPRYDENNKLHKKISINAIKLICAPKQYDAMTDHMDVISFITDPERRQAIMAQSNAVSAKIYNLTKQELKTVLDNFPIVDNDFKENVLDEFDLIGDNYNG